MPSMGSTTGSGTDNGDSTKDRDLDFKDPKSVMQLTKTLLKLDFDIKIELPDDRLCPPVSTDVVVACLFIANGESRSQTGTITFYGSKTCSIQARTMNLAKSSRDWI